MSGGEAALISSPAKLGRCRRHTATEGSRRAASVEAPVHVRAVQCFEDGIEDPRRPGDDVAVPEAKHPKATSPEISITSQVVVRLLDMLAAVQLDDETGFKTGKVRDEGSYGMLTAKPEARQLAAAQVLPKQILGVGWVATERSDKTKHHGSKGEIFGEVMTDTQLMREARDPSGPAGHLPTAWGGEAQ